VVVVGEFEVRAVVQQEASQFVVVVLYSYGMRWNKNRNKYRRLQIPNEVASKTMLKNKNKQD
jgi:hypothetical protein